MKRLIFSCLVLSLCSMSVLAQHKSEKAGVATRTFVGGTYLGTFQPKEADINLMPEFKMVRNDVNKSADQEGLLRYKDSLNRLKKKAGIIYDQSSNKTTEDIKPTLTSGFNALISQGTPPDNTIAVSNDGKIIAAVNSSLRVYSTNGSSTSPQKFFPVFWNSVTNKTNMCDPLVYYDANVDRFIIFTQVCDKITADNRFLMAFSVTNDPNGSYHYYSFRANLREIQGPSYLHDVWFDYPKIGVSQSDVFITGNLFRNFGVQSFPVESAIWQIDKNACFAGNSNPDAMVFNNLPGSPFTIVPAPDGLGGHYGDKMHLAVTANGNSATDIRMYTVDGKVQNSPSISTSIVPTTPYSQPADGVQQGSSLVLNSGDKRGMSAMYVDGTVHFAFHSNGPNNYIALNYNRLKRSGTGWTIQNKLISIPGVECAYPAVASMAHSPTEQAALIIFNYSSPTTYPGYRAVFVDHNMNVSDHIELNTGNGAVTYLPDVHNRVRWGDYCGVARKHNETRPTVWGFGTYGSSIGRWSNHISEIKSNAWALDTKDIKYEEKATKVYPNPVMDIWNLRLDIPKAGYLKVDIYNLMGKKVKDVFAVNVSSGESEFSFNKNGLANGTYFVKIFLNDKNISNEKIVVAK